MKPYLTTIQANWSTFCFIILGIWTASRWYTINWERFAGLNFYGFHGFQEYCEKFCEYKCLSLIILTNKYFWPGNAKVFLHKLQWGWNHECLAQRISPCLRYHYYYSNRVVMHCNKISFQELHNKKLQEILNRIMQRIISIITLALKQRMIKLLGWKSCFNFI